MPAIFAVLLMLVLVSACSTQADPSALVTPTEAVNTARLPESTVSVLTNRYNSARTGANLDEVILNHTNVNPEQFGKLFTREVEGHIYAQPLYVPNVEIPGKGIHNVVYVATMSNNVYAFDADDPALNEPLWQTNLGTPFTQDVSFDIPGGEVGVLSTPAIDAETQTIYLVSRNWEDKAVYNLHALDISTGEHKFGSPSIINLTVEGTGIGNVDGQIQLDSSNQLQRPGLLLFNDHIYIGFGSHKDLGVWFGWLAAYNASDIQELVAIFNTAPDGYNGGIWMGGTGISADDTFIYLVVANGTFNANNGGSDYGQSILKLQHSGDKFSVIDFFTPFNWDALNAGNTGLGSTGAVLISTGNLLVTGGKDGKLYVADTQSMGGFDLETNQNVQIFTSDNGIMYSTPIFWENGPGNLPTVYSWTEFSTLKAHSLDVSAKQFNTEASSESVIQTVGIPVAGLTLSANGTDPETGIVWALYAPSADTGVNDGVLVALNAMDLQQVLWHSETNAERDSLGLLAKFSPATVANGKVFVPTFSNQLVVYGLLQ